MKLGIVSRIGEFPEEAWESEFRFAGEKKLSHIEIVLSYPGFHPENFRKGQVNLVNKLAKKNNLEVILHLFSKYNPASSNDRERGESISEIISAYNLGNELNARIITIHGGRFRSFKTYSEDLETSRRTLEQVNPMFKDIKLCIENLPLTVHSGGPAKELPIEPEEILYLTENLRNIGITFDIGHANNFGNPIDFYDRISKSKKICNIHAHDNLQYRDDHLPLGEGNIDFKSFMNKLEKEKYKGYFSIELDAFNEKRIETRERADGIDYIRQIVK